MIFWSQIVKRSPEAVYESTKITTTPLTTTRGGEMRLIKQNVEKDGSGSITLFPEEPEDMVLFLDV